MKDCYSTYTFEYIDTETPADWMGRAGVEPPEFDTLSFGCFWKDNKWELVPVEPQKLGVAVCTPWQIRKALNSLGLRQAVEDAVEASDDIALKDGWEFATEFRSDDPFVLSMGTMLGKDEAETRELIEMAASL
jgi:hypothetical protein